MQTTGTAAASASISGKVYAKSSALSGNGQGGGTEIVIEDGAVLESSESAAIYHPQEGSLTIKGAKIKGQSGVELKAGTLKVIAENAVIEATGEVKHEANGNGPSTSGYAVAVVENSAYAGSAKFETSTGRYVGPIGILSDNDVEAGKEGSIVVSGGIYSQPVAPEYCAAGYVPKANDDGTYGVEKKTTFTLSGTVTFWNHLDNAAYRLYAINTAEEDIRADIRLETPTAGIAADAKGAVTSVEGSSPAQYSQSYTFTGLEAGSYKLAVYKPGHGVEIYTVTISDNTRQDAVLYQLGDVNGDGAVDGMDAVTILRKVAGLDVPTFIVSVADVNGDDVMGDGMDAVAILRKVAGLES